MNSENQKIEVYVTKFALTKGIIKMSGELRKADTTIFFYSREGGYDQFFNPKDYFLTIVEALSDAYSKKDLKIKSLQRQIEKLQKHNFHLIDNDNIST